MIRSELNDRINPTTSAKAFDMDTKKVTSEPSGAATGKADIDFLSLMQQSGQGIKEERAAKKNNDFSSAKNYDEFLEKLSESTKPRREPKNQLNKDDFLKLFVTQLQNQDPLNPDDGTEMASKLAQFNSLEQMLNVNKTLEKMVDGQNSARDIELINYIGKDITIDGGRARLKGGVLSETTANIKSPANEATLKIRDGAGTLVYERPLGGVQAGKYNLAWDGKTKDGGPAPDGIYTFSVEALGLNKEAIEVDITSKAVITGVDMKNKEGGLFTNLGVVKVTDVKAIGTRGFEDGISTQTVKSATGQIAGLDAGVESMLEQAQKQDPTHSGFQQQGDQQPTQQPFTPTPAAPKPQEDAKLIEDIRNVNRDSIMRDDAPLMNQAAPMPSTSSSNSVAQNFVDDKGVKNPPVIEEKQLPR